MTTGASAGIGDAASVLLRVRGGATSTSSFSPPPPLLGERRLLRNKLALAPPLPLTAGTEDADAEAMTITCTCVRVCVSPAFVTLYLHVNNQTIETYRNCRKPLLTKQ